MKKSVFFLSSFLCLSVVGFGQKAKAKYQEAKAAEYHSDSAAKTTERSVYIEVAFEAITAVVTDDPQYMDTFATITRKYALRNANSFYTYAAPALIKLGQKRASDQTYQIVGKEVLGKYKNFLLLKGFSPVPIFMISQERRDRFHCRAQLLASEIFELSWLVEPRTTQTEAWGKYAGRFYMMDLRHCGGEGGTQEKDPIKAFEIYKTISYKPGMHDAGKIVGDDRMELYIFGAQVGSVNHPPGYKFFLDQARSYYRGGSVTQAEVRATILRLQRKAEKDKIQNAVDVAEKALKETF